MDGRFISPNKSSNFLLLLSSVIFIGLYILANIKGADFIDNQLPCLVIGVLCGLTAALSMLWNRRAYIHIGENSITAKYHWFERLDCTMDEVEFVMPQFGTLTIFLKNRKRHVITSLENAWELGSAIRQQMFKIETEQPAILQEQLTQRQTVYKKELKWILGSIVLLFVNIFIAVLLTGGKDFPEFIQSDWICFAVMGVFELFTLVFLFYAAGRCGKHLLPMEQLKHRLRGAVITNSPLPNTHVTAVYTNGNYTGRIVVCGFPHDESVYCISQEINRNFELETIETSNIYANKDELLKEDFGAPIDITSFCHHTHL